MIDDIAKFDCVILRGLPGSGKSTLAARLMNERDYLLLEADQHFYVGGEYRFDPMRAADAHALVVRDALAHLQAGVRVIVANTHVRLWEMAGAVGAATLAAKSFCVIECAGTWNNIHNVPEDVIAAMKTRWEPLPDWLCANAFRWDGNSLERAPAAPKSPAN
ncbi:MAG: AAA family ATPase [Casimicrobium sp.]